MKENLMLIRRREVSLFLFVKQIRLIKIRDEKFCLKDYKISKKKHLRVMNIFKGNNIIYII